MTVVWGFVYEVQAKEFGYQRCDLKDCYYYSYYWLKSHSFHSYVPVTYWLKTYGHPIGSGPCLSKTETFHSDFTVFKSKSFHFCVPHDFSRARGEQRKLVEHWARAGLPGCISWPHRLHTSPCSCVQSRGQMQARLEEIELCRAALGR